MMNFKSLQTQIVALAAVAALGLTGCAATNGTTVLTEDSQSLAYHKAHNVPADGVALDGYCPVAYFAVDQPVQGKSEYSSTHNGITYYLVSADAKAAFDANPEKYVPAYGGWCAFGMSAQDKFPVDPRNFKIVDGQLMLFLKNPGVDALELWNSGNEAELVGKADKHWKKVQG